MRIRRMIVVLLAFLCLAACDMSAQDYADKYGGTADDYQRIVDADSCNLLVAFLDINNSGPFALAVHKRMEELDC